MSVSPPRVPNHVLRLLLLPAAAWFALVCWESSSEPGFALDFEPYYLQARALDAGEPPYGVRGTKLADVRDPRHQEPILPLTWSLLVRPLSRLDQDTAELGLMAFNILCHGVGVALLVLLFGATTRSRLLIVLLGLVFYPATHCIATGQLGILLFTLVAAALLLLRRNHPLGAAVCIGLATSIKLTPILLVVVLLARRRWGAVAATGLSFLAIQAGTILATDWQSNRNYWIDILPTLGDRIDLSKYNQSLLGLAYRVLGVSEPLTFLVHRVVPAAALLGIVALILRARRAAASVPARDVDDERLAVEFGLTMLVVNLITPLAWPHHFVWALLPLALLLGPAAAGRPRHEALLVAASVALFQLPIPMLPDWVATSGVTQLLSGPETVAAVLLIVALVRRHRRLDGDDPALPRSPAAR